MTKPYHEDDQRVVELKVFVHTNFEEGETLEQTGQRIADQITEDLRNCETSAGIDLVSTESLEDHEIPEGILSIFELDEVGECTGSVNLYCSEACRSKDSHQFEKFSLGFSPPDAPCDGAQCYECEKQLS